jgi:hypothetical protein
LGEFRSLWRLNRERAIRLRLCECGPLYFCWVRFGLPVCFPQRRWISV